MCSIMDAPTIGQAVPHDMTPITIVTSFLTSTVVVAISAIVILLLVSIVPLHGVQYIVVHEHHLL